MNNSYQQVCLLAAQLQAEGKTPSLALIRARAGKGVDAVALFSAYMQWRSQPTTQHEQVVPETTASPSQASLTEPTPLDIPALRQDIRRLEDKVEALSQLIQQLLVADKR